MLAIFAALFYASNAKSSLDILVMGDWGGSPNNPYTTPDEVASANIMGQVGSMYNVDMVWGLGDNFYNDGVRSENDPRFNETFESVFTAPSLINTPFYMVAGNHDHNGHVIGEINYSNKSSRWIFPNYWYDVTFTVPNTSYTLQLLMIDTVLLTGLVYDSHEYCIKNGIDLRECPLIQPLGAKDPELEKEQYQWIEETLKASTASFIIVAGHYPIYSIAEHGSTKALVRELMPVLQQYNVTAYMCGHDHTFEYINSGDGIDYIVTGGTHTCDPSTKHNDTVPANSLKFHGCDTGGFTRIKIDFTGLTTYYYYGSGTDVKYTVDTRQPRNV